MHHFVLIISSLPFNFYKSNYRSVHSVHIASRTNLSTAQGFSLNFENMSPVTDLKVYRGLADKTRYVWSPFVIKLEARLRFAGVPYAAGGGSPKTAPRGKIPYIEYQPSNGHGRVQMGDSSLIAKHFVEEGVLPDLNGKLSPEDRARDLATRALLEEKLCFYHVSFDIDIAGGR